MTVLGRALEVAAFLVAGLLFTLTSGEYLVAAALATLALPAAFVGRRLPMGANIQLVLGAAALGAAWVLGAERLESSIGGTYSLHPVAMGAALFGLLIALPRLWMVKPWGGRRATGAYLLFTVISCGGAVHGPLYPALAFVWGAVQLAALNALDPGRVPWSRLTRRNRGIALGSLGICAAMVVIAALALPPLHDYALRKLRRAIGRAHSGFSTHLRLGALQGMMESQTPVLRIHGPAPPLVRGVVWSTYSRGRWGQRKIRQPRTIGGLAPAEAAAADSTSAENAPAETTVIRTLGGDRRRLFTPLGLAAANTLDGRPRADEFGVLYPPAGLEAERVEIVLGPRATAPVTPPAPGDLVVPETVRPGLTEVARDWALTGNAARDIRTIRGRFQRDFRYSLEFEWYPGTEPVIEFLTARREGHCEYFASSAALLLRTVGVPARVVGGYRVTERNTWGDFHIVREANAHAWLEYWDGERWKTFDPTPAAPLSAHMAGETSPAQGLFDLLSRQLDRFGDWVAARSTTELLMGTVLPLTLWLVVSRLRGTAWRRRRRSARDGPAYADPLECLVALLAALAQRGVERLGNEALEDFAARARGRGQEEAAALLVRYAGWRYGGEGDVDAIAREMDELTTRLAAGTAERQIGSASESDI